jgi:drug/metabolite transporter (DMT)-like permease
MTVASAGVALMVADGVSVGGWLGLLFALSGTTMQSAYTVALRRGRGADMMPSVCLAAAVAAGFGFALGGDLDVSLHDAGVVAFAGLGSTALGNVVYIAAARRVRAAELALLTLAEVVLSPFWVWLVIGETPTPLALAGGLVVLGAVAWHAAGARGG